MAIKLHEAHPFPEISVAVLRDVLIAANQAGAAWFVGGATADVDIGVCIESCTDNVVPEPASHPTPAPVPAETTFTEVVAAPRRSAPVTSLDDLIGIAPIAEALIKTLAGKARTGRLDEMKALELLRQIVSL